MAAQKKYYDQKHRDIQFTVGDSVFAEHPELEVQGHSAQAAAEVLWPLQSFGEDWGSSIPIKLPDTWRVHPVFHVSLLKQWRPSTVQQVPGEVELDDADQPQYFDVEKILRWRWSSKTRRRRREFLVLWQGYPVEEAEWIPASFFSDPGRTPRRCSIQAGFPRNSSPVSEDRNFSPGGRSCGKSWS